jgi:hypothetical protein
VKRLPSGDHDTAVFNPESVLISVRRPRPDESTASILAFPPQSDVKAIVPLGDQAGALNSQTRLLTSVRRERPRMSAVAIAARCGSTWKASRRLFGDQDGLLPRPIA